MGKVKYVPIFCERKRREEWKDTPSWKRWDKLNSGSMTAIGRTYAVEVDGEWRCVICGERVSVILG